ncbi:hypothetical protein B0H12DRAFT_288117 [Mycena haematopus]|nr:hypothetical protein B0H12DRAFT_288117 [Mycena haematopus]
MAMDRVYPSSPVARNLQSSGADTLDLSSPCFSFCSSNVSTASPQALRLSSICGPRTPIDGRLTCTFFIPGEVETRRTIRRLHFWASDDVAPLVKECSVSSWDIEETKDEKNTYPATMATCCCAPFLISYHGLQTSANSTFPTSNLRSSSLTPSFLSQI